MGVTRQFGIAAMAGLMLATAPGAAQEVVTFTVPVYQSAGVSTFRVETLYLKRAMSATNPAEIRAQLREADAGSGFVEGGKVVVCAYDGALAASLIAALNTANLSTKSLERRVVERCQADGKIGAGSMTGSPQ